jgi:hypothetical protein
MLKVGDWVRTKRDFVDIPEGTLGRVCEDYGEGIMIAWRIRGYDPHPDTDNLWLIDPRGPRLRDGFNKGQGQDRFDERIWLEKVDPPY